MKKLLYSSPFGNLILVAGHGKLLYCNWNTAECRTKQTVIESLFGEEEEHSEDKETLEETCQQLDEYFAGKRNIFDLSLEFSGTEFRKKVWTNIYEICYGETISYKELAETSGVPKGYRAVAQACGANPISIIVPCHRILASNSNLGGYTGGIDKKIALLNLEQKFR